MCPEVQQTFCSVASMACVTSILTIYFCLAVNQVRSSRPARYIHLFVLSKLIARLTFLVEGLNEKPQNEPIYIKDGFILCEPALFDYLSEQKGMPPEESPLRRLAPSAISPPAVTKVFGNLWTHTKNSPCSTAYGTKGARRG